MGSFDIVEIGPGTSYTAQPEFPDSDRGKNILERKNSSAFKVPLKRSLKNMDMWVAK